MIGVSEHTMKRLPTKNYQIPTAIQDAMELLPESQGERNWIIACAAFLMFLDADDSERLYYISEVRSHSAVQDWASLVSKDQKIKRRDFVEKFHGQPLRRAAKQRDGSR